MKKIASLILIMSIVFSSSTLVNAKNKESYDPKTKITKSNLNSILEHYGLDASTIRTDIDSSNTEPITTVGELEKTLKRINEIKKKASYNIKSENGSSDLGGISPMYMPINGVKRLSRSTLITDTWGITAECDGSYTVDGENNYKFFTGVANPSVRLYNPWYLWIPNITYSLDRVNSISASYNSVRVSLSYSATVGTYATIGIGDLGIPINVLLYETTVSSTVNWGTESIPNY